MLLDELFSAVKQVQANQTLRELEFHFTDDNRTSLRSNCEAYRAGLALGKRALSPDENLLAPEPEAS